MFDLYEEFRKLSAALDDRQIEYALCGGLAMAVYNHPRATIDIDLLILSEALDSVTAIAKELGYTIRGLDKSFSEGAIEIRRVSKIHPSTGHVLSLDLLLVTPDLRSIWDSRIRADWEYGELSIVSRAGMPKIDMSAEAVTARLKLVSELTRLCLLLGTAKLKSPESRAEKQKRQTRTPR